MRLPLLILLLVLSFPLSSQNDLVVHRGKKYICKGEHKLFRTRYDSIRNFSENRAAVCLNGKWGYIDTLGQVVIPLRYAAAMNMHNGVAGVKMNSREYWLVINRNGRKLAQANFDTVYYLDSLALGVISTVFERVDTVYSVYRCNSFYSYDEVYRITKFDSLYLFYFRDHILRSGNKPRYQLVDAHLNPVTKPFDPVDSILQKEIIIKASQWSEGYAVLSKDGRVSPWYDEIGADSNGFRIVSAMVRKGVINSRFQPVIGAAHEGIRFCDGQFIVSDSSRVALYDTTGKRISPAYDVLGSLGCNMWIGKNKTDSTCVLFNFRGEITSTSYQCVSPFHSGLARVLSVDTTHYAFIDSTGRLVSKWYPCATDFHEVGGGKDYQAYKNSFHGGSYYSGGESESAGLTIFRIFMGIATVGTSEIFLAPHSGSGSGKSTKLEPMTEEEYNKCYFGDYSHFYGSDFQNGYSSYTILRPTRQPNKYNETNVYYGLLDSTGKEISKAEYTSIKALDTFFVIQKATGYGLMTRSGKVILQPKYGPITLVRSNYFSVQDPSFNLNYALFMYDGVKGKFLTSFSCYSFADGGESTIIVEKFGNWGFMDQNGKFIVPMKYSAAQPFSNEKAWVRSSDPQKWFYIDKTGKKVE